jgi:hypothetical protein
MVAAAQESVSTDGPFPDPHSELNEIAIGLAMCAMRLAILVEEEQAGSGVDHSRLVAVWYSSKSMLDRMKQAADVVFTSGQGSSEGRGRRRE